MSPHFLQASCRSLILLLAGLGMTAAVRAQAPGKAPTVVIPAEPLDLKPGAPLSPRVLTSLPTPLPRLASWTLETRGHRSEVWAVAYRPDGKWLATGGRDSTIRILDVETGQLVKALAAGHTGVVWALAWSPDGNTLASAASDGLVKLWDGKTGRLLRTFKKHKNYCWSLAWSPDGQTLLSGGRDSLIQYWDVRGTKNPLPLQENVGEEVQAVAWSPDGQTICSGGGGVTVRVFDVSTNKLLHVLEVDQATSGLAWSPDGKQLAVAGPKNVQLWHPRDKKQLKVLPTSGYAVSWSPDGKQLAVGVSTSNVGIWDVGMAKQVRTLTGALGMGVAWRPDGNEIASAGRDGAVRLFDAADGKLTRTYAGHAVAFRGVARSPDGKVLAASTEAGAGYVFEVASGRLIRAIEPGQAWCLTWSPDGRVLAGGGGDGTIRLWDPLSGKATTSWQISSKTLIQALAYSPSGKTLASSAGKEVKLWEIPTGKELHTLTHPLAVPSLAWTQDGKQLTTGCADGMIRLWDPITGTAAKKTLGEHRGSVLVLRWSRNGAYLASGGQDAIAAVRDPDDGKVIRTLEEYRYAIHTLAWTPDNTFLAVGGLGGSILLWNTRTGAVAHSLAGHNYTVGAVAWLPDGKTLVSLSGQSYVTDGAILYWNAPAGQQVGRLIALANPAALLAVDPDGHYRGPVGIERELAYVAQTDKGQETLAPAEFAKRFGWKNVPTRVQLIR